MCVWGGGGGVVQIKCTHSAGGRAQTEKIRHLKQSFNNYCQNVKMQIHLFTYRSSKTFSVIVKKFVNGAIKALIRLIYDTMAIFQSFQYHHDDKTTKKTTIKLKNQQSSMFYKTNSLN